MQTSSQRSSEPKGRPTSGDAGNKKRRVALTPHKDHIEGWVSEGKSDAWIASALGTSPSSVQSFRSRHDIHRGSGRRPSEAAAEEAPAGEDNDEREQSVYEGALEHGQETGYGLWLDPAVADDAIFQRGFARVSDINVCIEKDRIILTPAAGAESAGSNGVSAEELQRLQPGLTDFERAEKSAPSSNRESGRLKFFDGEKGFGFIVREGGKEIFFHMTELKTVGEPEQGAELSFKVSSNNRGLVAVDVRAGR